MSTNLLDSIVFGSEQLGGHNWGNYDRRDIYDAIDCALYHGLKRFDTADCYGAGESESLLGAHIASKRSDVFIATKFGVRINNHGGVFYDTSGEWCKDALHQSLKRLKIDSIDLYQMHYWDGVSDIFETIDMLEMVKKQGLIKHYGFCNIDLKNLNKILSNRIYSYSADFSLLSDANESAARVAVMNGARFLPYGVLGQGILSGKYNESSVFPSNDRRSMGKYRNFSGPGLIKSMSIVSDLKNLSELSGLSPAQLSIIWASKYIENSMPIVGIKNVDQIISIVNAFEVNINNKLIDDLNNIYIKHNK